MTTLTSLIEEVGTWDPAVLASACRDESRDVIISRMAAIFDVDAVSKMSPEEEEKIQTDFAEAFDAMDLVQAYIFSVNLPSLISMAAIAIWKNGSLMYFRKFGIPC